MQSLQLPKLSLPNQEKHLIDNKDRITGISKSTRADTKKPYSQMGKEVVKCGYEKRKETQGVPERLDG